MHLAVVVVGLRRAEAEDARHRGDDDHVAAREQRRRGGVAQPVDLLVDRRVLLDVEVPRRDVGLGLVVVVVGDEVLDRVRREVRPELVAELRGERLVVGHDQRRPLHRLDRRRHRHRLAGAGGAQQRRAARRPPRCPRPAPSIAFGWSAVGRVDGVELEGRHSRPTVWNGDGRNRAVVWRAFDNGHRTAHMQTHRCRRQGGTDQPWLADAAADLAEQTGAARLGRLRSTALTWKACLPRPRSEFRGVARSRRSTPCSRRLREAGVEAERRGAPRQGRRAASSCTRRRRRPT